METSTQPRFLERLVASADAPNASLPSRPTKPDGSPRRVGVEIEFVGLELQPAARALATTLPATLTAETEYEARLESEALGTFVLEVDNQFLKDLGRRREERGKLSLLRAGAEAVMASAIGTLTPLELVTPPLAPAHLPVVDTLVLALADLGAQGTQDGLLSAFGVHYNPELPALDAPTIWRHVRAYVVLQDWLRESLNVDFARKASGFVQPYPSDFREHVLSTPEPATHDELIDRYLQFNPTRNRGLDLLPLLTHLDRERVESALDEEGLAARPTFHFRLPNSLVGEEDWSVSRAWRHWLIVEDLAADGARLERAETKARRYASESLMHSPPTDEEIRQWLSS